MKNLFYAIAMLAAVAATSCGKKKEMRIPSPEFASYVSAYTGGVISTSGAVRIELARAHTDVEPNTPVKEKLFSFSPSVKGKACWVSDNVIEFQPDEGQLKPGRIYDVDFDLGKIEQVDKKLRTFGFSFRTREQDFEVHAEAGVVAESNPTVMAQQYELLFSDVVDAQAVAGMVALDGAQPSSVEPAEGKAASFRISFEGLERGTEDKTMQLTVKGKPVGVNRREEYPVVVPATGNFRFLEAVKLTSPATGVSLVFSDPLDAAQDLRGLVVVPEVDDYVTEIENNLVKIFFPAPYQGRFTIDVEEGIRSADGHRLSNAASLEMEMDAIKPAVELTSEGTIMPDSKNLILSFRAVNLSAVDLKIVRIYESNVLMFLQTNTLDGGDELRRSGRQVYDKPLYLTGARNTAGWQDYSVDLSEIIKQERGAIYRIQLSMRQEYSTYPCGGAASAAAAGQPEGIMRLAVPEAGDEEDSPWDKPYPYYYDYGEYDYGDYNWRDRNDPCKPTYYMDSERRVSANVMASNLGVIVKTGGDRRVFVAASDILTTRPADGAKVTVYNYQLRPIGSGTTDREGFATIEVKGVGFVTVVEKEGWKTYVRMVDGEQNSLSRFDVGGRAIEKGLKGFIYGERGVWRPGDTLHVTFVLEDRLGKIPAGHPVTFELFNPRGQFYTRQVNAGGMNGFYTFAVPTLDTDPTGLWNAYVKVGGASFHKSLRVETIKPNRLKINLRIANNRIERATPATLDVSWLTGATARNLKAVMEMKLVRGGNSPFKGFERYTFNNPASSFTSEKVDVYSGRTDGEGHAAFTVNAPAVANAPGMLRADVVCRVFEPGGDASTYVESFPYSPFSRYEGINLMKGDGEYFETDRDNMLDIATVNAAGQAVEGQVDYKIYKLRWSWWWEKGEESLDAYVNGNYASPVDQGTVSTPGGRGKIKLRVDYPEWGRYLIYAKDRTSGHATGGIVYMDWPSSYGRAARTDPDGAAMLTFTTDKKAYEAGEKCTVVIPEAPGARALVSFENGSAVLGSKWVDMAPKGDTKYTFEVTADMAPNFYIHISLLQPHAQTANSLPIRLYGVQPVEVNNKASRLEPVVTAPDVLRPQTQFTVKVAEKTGREMTYTLAIVDEGLLDLTNFKTPDPWKEFYSREALGVRTWDMYDYVMGAFGGRMGPLLSVGGDQELKPGDRKANRFKPVVKFLGPFTVKKGSSNSHKVTLPMYIGSVRVMVVAGGGAAYGCAEKAIPVRTPLMVLPTLPRTVSIGEDITLPVNLFAMESDVKNVTVKVDIAGGLKLACPASQTVCFSKPGDRMVYFRLRAGTQTGAAKVKVTAVSGRHTATDQIEIAVRNPNPLLVGVTDTMVAAGESITLPYDLTGEGTDNSVRLEVARMPSVDLSRRYDYLDNYEHLCTEQLTSKGFPMLYLAQFRDVDKTEAEKIRKGVQSIIGQLYGRQLSNGAFAYWPGHTTANEWIASYAGNFLWEASQHGYEVNKGVLDRWKAYQKRAARSWSLPRDRDRDYYWYYQPELVQAYRLYTLALAGAPEVGAMNRMKEMQNLSVAARWRLAAAYAVSGKQKAAAEVVAGIRSAVEAETYSRGHGYTYGSAERDASMILETMVQMGDMTGAMRQAREVSAMLSAETYLSTQSTAFALVAMGSLASKMAGGEVHYAWNLPGQAPKEVKTARAVHQQTVPATKGAGEVTMANRSKGELFVSLVTTTRPMVDRQPAVASNLMMKVVYVDMQGNPIQPATLDQGTDFRATVTVTNISGTSDYTDLALTHIIPSGWEIFNERMALSDQALEQDEAAAAEDEGDDDSYSRPVRAPRVTVPYTYQDIRDDRVLTYFDLRRGESKSFTVRLQAAYAGRFILPAVLCEAMYDPTVRARTIAGWAEVK